MNPATANKWILWTRLACVAIAIGALYFVFRGVDRAAFLLALRQMRFGWFVGANALFGVALVIAGARWHLALRLTHCTVHQSASARVYCMGHFLFLVLFGGVGGDVAKSAIYARWFGLPFPEVLAAVPLDRLLGFGGLFCFGLSAAGWTLLSGGFSRMPQLEVHLPPTWGLVAFAAAALFAGSLVWWQPSGGSAGAKTLRAIRAAAKRLVLAPRVMLGGLLYGFLAQVCLSGMLAFNLQAVTQASLPWTKLLWTLPVISVASNLPVTVAGLGFREGAAAGLLPWYGVPKEDALAASVLSLAVFLAWAAIGGFLLAREERLFQKTKHRPQPRTLSVVIPTLNEAESLAETVTRARGVPEVTEIIVTDGGSTDQTRELAAKLGCRVCQSSPGRGGQMRLGAAQANGDVIVLLHADTWLPPAAGRAVLNALRDRTVVGGGFWKIFRDPHPLLLGSRWRCAVRFYLSGSFFGDQAMFVRREALLQIGGVPDQPLMEEFELCRRLRQVGRLALADATVTTSARRFRKLGVVRTYLRMWRVLLLYRAGKSPQDLQQIYERE